MICFKRGITNALISLHAFVVCKPWRQVFLCRGPYMNAFFNLVWCNKPGMVLLLLTFCLLLLPLRESVIVSLRNVHSSIAIILMGKRELVALLNLSSWCLVMVELLFLVVPWGCLGLWLWYFLIILTYYFLDSSFLYFYAIQESSTELSTPLPLCRWPWHMQDMPVWYLQKL